MAAWSTIIDRWWKSPYPTTIRLAPRIGSAGCMRDASQAGAALKSRPVSNDTNNAKDSTVADGVAWMGT